MTVQNLVHRSRPKTMAKTVTETPTAMHGEQYITAGSARVIQRGDNLKSKTQGCWGAVEKAVRTIWMTKHTEDVTGEQYIRASLRELVIYVVFLLVLCIIAFMMTSTNMYYHKFMMDQLFIGEKSPKVDNYHKITGMDDFWWWINGPFLDALYWEKLVNLENSDANDTQMEPIFHENKLIGRAQLRQLRVRNDSCSVPTAFEREIKHCYNTFLPAFEEKSPFPGHENTSTAWNYHNSSIVKSEYHWGRVASYPAGGYVQVLSNKKEEALQEIQALLDGRWIDQGTRVVFIDFTVYNANINLFCITQIVFEFPPAGGVVVSNRFNSVKLLRYVSGWDQFVMVCEVIFCVFLLYYIIEEIIEIAKHRLSYFTEFWNYLDVLVLGIAITCITFGVLRHLEVENRLSDKINDSSVYVDFTYLGYIQNRLNDCIAIMVFIAWVKVFKYISFNATMSQLATVLHRCAKDVGGFAVMFFIFFLAYAQLGFMIFGTQVRDFSTFYDAMFTLLRTIMGDFDFYQLEKTDRLLGPIYFISYVFFVFFVLLNMFLAIINDTYAEVKDELRSKQNEFEIMDLVKKGYFTVARAISKEQDQLEMMKEALAKDDTVDQQKVRDRLRIRGYKDDEIEQIFERYNIEPSEVIEREEILRVQHDINEHKYELERLEEQIFPDEVTTNKLDKDIASNDDFSVLNRRIDRVEHSLGSLVSQMDDALEDLAKMEKDKEKHVEQCHFVWVNAKKMREGSKSAVGR